MLGKPHIQSSTRLLNSNKKKHSSVQNKMKHLTLARTKFLKLYLVWNYLQAKQQ